MINIKQRIPSRINNFTRVRGRVNHGCTIVKRGNWAKKNHVFDRCPECGRIRFYWQCRNNKCGYSENIYSAGGQSKIVNHIWECF